MLVPITRTQFEQLVPIVATGAQYKHSWGKFADFLRRLLISILGVCVIYFSLHWLFPDDSEWLTLLPVIVAGLYWWWEPILLASRQNWQSRQVPYSGFWRGEVLDVYITDKLVGERESVDNQGNLVVIEDLETRLNLELGDETGFSTKTSVPFKKAYKSVYPGQTIEAIVMSYRPDLSSFAKVSDLYIPDLNLWLSDYPYLRRDAFVEMSRQIDDVVGDRYDDDDDDYYYEPRTQQRGGRR